MNRRLVHRLPGSFLVLLLAAISCHPTESARAEDEEGSAAEHRPGPARLVPVPDAFFVNEVWPKVGELICLKCHRAGGDAEESDLVLSGGDRVHADLGRNAEAFRRVALQQEEGRSRLLAKVAGELDHGGGAVLAADSSGYCLLERYVTRLSRPNTEPPPDPETDEVDVRPFFEGVRMASPRRLLRRVTLSLAARLPTAAELTAIDERGEEALPAILDDVLREEAFFVRLKEGFNDVLLTLGYDGNGEEVLSYEHFQTRLWYQEHSLDHLPEKDRQKARYKLADQYREAMLREPLELIAHIVREGRPFTEIVTADYIMVSPYTARGYGIFDEVRDRFENPDDPFEYVPVTLPALVARNGKVQESPTGGYPHAGLLAMFHYLRRYPTTETNRNRLRARMYYQHFLGIDVMALAPRTTDAAAVAEKYEIPTMQAADCVVCHRTIDPVAGLFQDFNADGHLGPRKEGWYTDMFGPGLEGEALPDEERWRSLQWLGERTARDPRFAIAMVEHVYGILLGRPVLKAPEDIDDPRFLARRRAWRVQREVIERVAVRFAEANFDLKAVFKELILSDFYRADGLATAVDDPDRLAELDDVGIVRLLTPEQLERKIAALFGQRWGRLGGNESQLDILYGGIDSKSVTERMTDPSGAMGAIQRIMANDIACEHVARDFTRSPSERRLFPDIEPDDLPDAGPEAEARIRRAIVHLHEYLLGRSHAIDDPEVDRTFALFAGIVRDAREAKGVEKVGSYFCERIDEKRLPDPDYTLRAWRGVVTYLLRQHDFLYE